MSNDYAIRVKNLHKHFKLYGSPKNMLKELISGRTYHTEFHALKDISFDVKRGEVVGVMGRNGAGKSTLLRILAGTLNATSGTVETKGRVSAILELGSGFNPEYTGRENIISGGLVLGMSKEEITSKVDDIITFAELEDFIDNLFKTYSSGMQARLTFATAISVNPDILIVDEALSVGDAAFQAKCYTRIQSMRDAGTSIFLVSHSENAITHFCDRAILLERGELLIDASPREVTMAYCDMVWGKKKLTKENATICVPIGNDQKQNIYENSIITDAEFEEIIHSPHQLTQEQREALKAYIMQKHNIAPFVPNKLARRMGEREMLEILDFGIFTPEGERITYLQTGHEYVCTIKVLLFENINEVHYGFTIRNSFGNTPFATNSLINNDKSFYAVHGERANILYLSMKIVCWLANTYFFMTANVTCKEPVEKIIDGFYDGFEFSVLPSKNLFTDSYVSLEHDFIPIEKISTRNT